MSTMADSIESDDFITEQRAQLKPRVAPQSHEKWNNYQLLKWAIRHGEKEQAKHLILQEGVPVNVKCRTPHSFHKVTPLHLAVHLGCLELIQDLLDRGASVTIPDLFGETPLALSVRLRKFSVTDLLLTANITEVCGYGLLNNLHIACLRNNMSAVKKLIYFGADINEEVSVRSSCWAGYTALHFAVESHSIDIVELLLNNGADMMKKNAKSLTPLHLADEVRNEIIIDILLSAQMLQLGNPQDFRGLSHFHIACTRNNVDVVEYFLKQGVDVNSQVPKNVVDMWSEYEPLKFAVYYECTEVVETLLLHGARLRNSEDDMGCVELAYEIGNGKIINLLLTHKAAKSRRFSVRKEMSEFQIACAENNVQKIETMLSQIQECHPLELNSPLWSSSTPLHLLVKNLSRETIELILKFGADVSIRDARGQTPLHLLFEKCPNHMDESVLIGLSDFVRNPVDEFGLSHFHIVCTTKSKDLIGKFLENGANVNCTVYDNSLRWPGWSPLHFAVKFRNSTTIDTLLKHGASISIKDSTGSTPFDIAIMNLNGELRLADKTKNFKIVEKILLEAEKRHHDFEKHGFSLFHLLCATRDDEPDFAQLANDVDMSPGIIDQTIDFPKSRYHLYTPFHFAIKNYNNEIAKWLIDRGANIFLEDCDGYSALQHEIDFRGPYGIFEKRPELLLVPGDLVDINGCPYFHSSCLLGDRKVMEYHLRSGIDIDLRRKVDRSDIGSCHNLTPLHSIIFPPSDNAVSTAKFLLDNGADINAGDGYLDTPLHLTNLNYNNYHYNELVKLLFDYGADINAVNLYNETSLLQVCQGAETSERVLLLLEFGADINIESDHGETPLTHVCDFFMKSGNANREIVVALLRHAKKLMVLGSYVSVKNQLMCSQILQGYTFSNFNETVYEERCSREIERMKKHKINQYTTLYNVLSKSPNEMAYLSQNSSFREMIDSDGFSPNFPFYGYLVKLQLKRGLVRKPLLEKSKNVICSMIGDSAESAEKILDYLDDKDLKNIIKIELITPLV